MYLYCVSDHFPVQNHHCLHASLLCLFQILFHSKTNYHKCYYILFPFQISFTPSPLITVATTAITGNIRLLLLRCSWQLKEKSLLNWALSWQLKSLLNWALSWQLEEKSPSKLGFKLAVKGKVPSKLGFKLAVKGKVPFWKLGFKPTVKGKVPF